MNSVFLVIIILGAGILIAFWLWRIQGEVRRARVLRNRNRRSPEDEEEVSDAWTGVARDVLLGVLCILAVSYCLTVLGPAAVSEAGAVWRVGSAQVPDVTPAGRAAGQERLWLVRTSLAVASFAVVGAFVFAFAPGALPYPRESRLSVFLSAVIAVALATFFSAIVATPGAESDRLVEELSSGLRTIVVSFFSVLITGISIWLAWRQIWRYLKPK